MEFLTVTPTRVCGSTTRNLWQRNTRHTVSTGKTRIIFCFSTSTVASHPHLGGGGGGKWRRRLSSLAGIYCSISVANERGKLLYCSIVSPRASRNSWGSSQWWFDWGTSTASAACTSPGPVRSCRPGRRSAPRRWLFARTCAWTASPTAPACRLSARRWWSPAAYKTDGT